MRLILGSVMCAAVFAALEMAAADDGPNASYLDLRVGWSQPAGLSIEENVAGTTSQRQGEDERGHRGQIEVLYGLDRDRGFFAGAGFSYTRWDTTPVNYRSGSVITARPVGGMLDARLAMLDLQVGYGLGSPISQSLSLWFEAAPVVGIGWMSASSDISGQIDRGNDMAYEFGARAGLYLEERHWMVGVTGAWSRVRSDVDVDVGGATNTLRIDGQGFRLGVEAGYRF